MLQAGAIFVAPDAVQRPRVVGRVEAATGQVLHVVTRTGESINVHWDAETSCAPIACADIPAGAWVGAVGEELGGPNLDASHLRVRVPNSAD